MKKLKWFWKVYLGFLGLVLVLGIVVMAFGHQHEGEQILRNGFFYATIVPIAFIMWAIGAVAGVAHNSGILSGPQLLAFMFVAAIFAIFFGIIFGGLGRLFKAGASVFGAGGGGGGHKPH